MTYIDWIGSAGVFLILLAYVFNAAGKLGTRDLIYILMNFIGASLACYASVLMDYVPFIILEAVWATVSLFSLIRYNMKN